MGSICGTVDLGSGTASFDHLKTMARILKARGGKGSGAYVRGGAMLHSAFESQSLRQPLTTIKDGRELTLALDGEMIIDKECLKPLSLPDTASTEMIALEIYFKYGTEALSFFSGSFALAIYDERRKELILARDKKGAKPLYYAVSGTNVFFASEIKALLGVCPFCLEVDRAAVSELILSGVGEITGVDLYRYINEIPPHCFATLSRLGLQISMYKSSAAHSTESPIKPISLAHSSPFEIEDSLSLSLYAHDYPTFDEYTPAYIKALKEANGKVCIEDPSLLISESYALERADRLGSLFSANVTAAEPRESRQAKKKGAFYTEAEKKLTERVGKLFSIDCEAKKLIDKRAYESALSEKDQLRRLRSLSLILQTELWLKLYPIIPV